MAHRTFVSIRCLIADQEYHLFLKNDDGFLEFFTATDKAMNGSYKYTDVKQQFCEKFHIEPSEFEKFRLDESPIDLSDVFEHGSNSIAQLSVDEVFYKQTSVGYDWILKNDLELAIDRFAGEHKLVYQKLFQEKDVPQLPADLLEGIRNLQNALAQQKLVVFAGAGISKDSGVPLWGELKDKILGILGPDISPNTDSTIIAQYLYIARGQKEYNEKIRELLGYRKDPKPQPNETHKALFDLRPKHIISTNFDDLLEKALLGKYSVIRCDQDFPYKSPAQLLVKMHGDWDLMNFVFKEEDYLSYSRKWPLTEGFVRGVFASHVVLFIGFSFDDRNLKQILDWVREILGNDLQPAYLFLTSEKNEHEQSYFRSKGLHLLSWPEGYQIQINRYGQKPTKGPSLEGEKVSDFIKFLAQVNLDTHELKQHALELQILDQMFEAFRAFHAFNSLPSYSIEKIFPFSPFRLSDDKSQADANIYLGRLNVRNESIIQLMKSVLFLKDRIVVKEDGLLSQEILNIKDHESKLWYVFDKLNSSKIRCIHRQGEDEHHPIQINNPFSPKLLFSKWIEWRLDDLLEAIQKREYAFGQPNLIPEPLRDGLLDGYVLFQMNFFDLAYDVFFKVGEEAKQSGDTALYFLCIRNRLKAGHEIYWRGHFGHYSKSFANQVRNEAEKMDLNEVLHSINVEAPVRQLLQDIQEGNVLRRFINEVEDELEEILKIKRQYQNAFSFHSGPNYALQLEWAFENLCWFYDSNGIIPNERRPFERAAEQTLEGLIASYQTSERYQSRYEGFTTDSFQQCLRWIQPKKLQKLLKKYDVKDVPFAAGHKELFLHRAINLFKCAATQNSLFGNISENKRYINYLETNSLYAIEEKRLIPNLLQILRYVDLDDLPKKLSDQLCVALLHSLEYLPKYLNRLEDVLPFFQQHLKSLNNTQVETLLNLLVDRSDFRSHYLMNFSNRLREIRPDFRISSQGFFEKLLVVKNGRYDSDRLSGLIAFFDFLDDTFQQQLTEAIQANLKTAVHLELYLEALLAGCIPGNFFPQEVKDALKNSFEKISRIQFAADGEIEPFESTSDFFGGETPHGYAWQVQLISRIRYVKKLDRRTLVWFLKQPNLPECLRWVLKPKDFDYSQFDHFWLFFITAEEEVLEKLAELKIPDLQEAIQRALGKRFSERIAAVYFKYFAV